MSDRHDAIAEKICAKHELTEWRGKRVAALIAADIANALRAAERGSYTAGFDHGMRVGGDDGFEQGVAYAAGQFDDGY